MANTRQSSWTTGESPLQKSHAFWEDHNKYSQHKKRACSCVVSWLGGGLGDSPLSPLTRAIPVGVSHHWTEGEVRTFPCTTAQKYSLPPPILCSSVHISLLQLIQLAGVPPGNSLRRPGPGGSQLIPGISQQCSFTDGRSSSLPLPFTIEARAVKGASTCLLHAPRAACHCKSNTSIISGSHAASTNWSTLEKQLSFFPS